MYQPKRKIVITLLLAAAFMAGCSSRKNEQNAKQDALKTVNVMLAVPAGNSDNSIMASGQIESSQTANISTRVMGYITKLTVKVGDRVSQGQLLATISNDDMLSKRAQVDAMITEAEAAVKNAQKDVERFNVLYKQQSATAKELDNVMLQYNSMKAKLEAAKQMRNEVNASLAYTHLTAPFSGVVVQKLMDAGSMANPGMPILIIDQNGSLQISANIPESDIQHVKINDDVIVEIKSLNKNFHTKISQVNPSSQFTGGQYVIKMNIPEEEKRQVYAGMYVNISIPSKEKNTVAAPGTNTVMIPLTSVVNKDQLTGIYTVSNNNVALLRWVRLGKTFGDKVEVLSGLALNEPYIVSADGKLYNGVSVTIKK
jgi:RND family efflux transporter, MFP subunit